MTIIKKLFFRFIFISFFLLTATVLFSQTAKADVLPIGQGEKYSCRWHDSGHISCAKKTAVSRDYLVNQDYFYSPKLSIERNAPVFVDRDYPNPNAYLIIQSSGAAADFYEGDRAQPNNEINEKGNITNEPNEGRCGLTTSASNGGNINCDPGGAETRYNGPQWEGAEGFLAMIEAMEDCAEDAGVLGHFICPIYQWINNAIGNLIGISGATTDGGRSGNSNGLLIDLMTIPPITATGGGDTSDGIYKAWSAMKDIALGLYVVIFLVALFANSLSLGIDNYTIKKTLPRLIAGAILTQFSFLIVAVLVDISNLVGTVVPSLIIKAGGGGFTFGFDSMVVGSTLATLGIILLIILSVIALFSLLVAVFTFLARQLIVFALVIVAPIAFLLWILPNTEKFYKMWWDNLIKVLMMYPIATGLIALALLFSNTIGQTDANDALKVFAGLVPVIALIMLPKTFKWGGSAFAAIGGAIAAKGAKARGATGKGIGKAAKAGGKAGYQKALASDGAIGKAAAFFGGGFTQNQRTMKQAKARNTKIEDAEKAAKGAASLPDGVQRLEHMATTGNRFQQEAAIGQLLKKGDAGRAAVARMIANEKTRSVVASASYSQADAFEKHMDLAFQARSASGTMSREDIGRMSDERIATQSSASAKEISKHMDTSHLNRVLSSKAAESMPGETRAVYQAELMSRTPAPTPPSPPSAGRHDPPLGGPPTP